MKLLVTGGYGFIGSNFILKLLEEHEEFKITNIDAELGGSNPKNLLKINNNKNYKFVKGNITNHKLMEELINECDIVVNFAAESFVDRSIKDANPFLVSNIRGAFTLMDITTKQNKRFVQVSTDEVFGDLKKGRSREKARRNAWCCGTIASCRRRCARSRWMGGADGWVRCVVPHRYSLFDKR